MSERHDVSFEEAVEVFFDELDVTIPEPDHSEPADREMTMGHCYRNRLLFIAHCPREERVGIISA